MRPHDRLGLASTIGVFLAALSLLPLTLDRGFLGVGAVLLVLLFLTGLVLRRTPWGNAVAIPGQLVVVLAFQVIWALRLDPVEGAGPIDAVLAMFTAAASHMETQSAPMAPDDGVRWLLVAGIGTMAVATDLLVNGLRRHVWAIAPLLTLFLVPALSLQADLSVLQAIAVGVGYLGVLLAEGINRAEQWRRGVVDDPDNPVRPVGALLWGSAALVAVPALVLALIGTLVMPNAAMGFLGGGRGTGNSGPLQLTDPTLDLRRSLNRPDDLTVLTYRTTPDTGGGVYLRMASLPAFDSSGWQNAAISVVQGQPGPIPGAGGETGTRRTTTVEIGNFRSEYLPLPYAPRRVDVAGSWGYDPESLVYLSSAERQTDRVEATQQLSYTVESLDIEPDGEQLSLAPVGVPADSEITTPLPDGFPPEIVALAGRITADQPTPALQAAAIQSYLRSSEFTYSTEPEPGSGYQALTNFLFVDKSGYCEQFATAMAAMARAVGIPSRVAIGFLPGDRVGPGTYEVSAHDLHAWPELYFEGIGWVQWEPTPGNGAIAPPWTLANQGGTGPSEAPEPTATASSAAPTEAPSSSQTVPTTDPSAPVATDDAGADATLRAALIGVGIALVLLALAAVPGSVRWRRRHIRLAGTGPPAQRAQYAWDEVRDTVVDHRGRWPQGSPRAIGRQLAHDLDRDAVGELTRLAVLVERSRFARHFDTAEQVAGVEDAARTVRAAVIAPTSRWQRIRAAVAPRSLLTSPLWSRGGSRAG